MQPQCVAMYHNAPGRYITISIRKPLAFPRALENRMPPEETVMKFSIAFIISPFFISNFKLPVMTTYIPRPSLTSIFTFLFTMKIKTLIYLLGTLPVTTIPIFGSTAKINFSKQSHIILCYYVNAESNRKQEHILFTSLPLLQRYWQTTKNKKMRSLF